MLVAQAKRACELFTDKDVPDTLTEKIVTAVKKQTLNITLVGMPGSGKTTFGNRLSRLLDREFIDADQEFYSLHGVTAGEYIERNGESAFRDEEEKVLSGLLKQSRKIIATGGGAVIREQNRINMRANSVVVWIERDLSELAKDGRPLSNKYGTEKLYQDRYPLYSSVSDIRFNNDGAVNDKAESLLGLIGKYFGE